MIQRLSAGQASDAANAELLVQVLAFLRRILSVRNLCVYSAHLGIAGGARSLPLEQHIAAQPLLTTHQLYMKPGDAAGSSELMHAATAALRASGAAGASLARVLEEPYAPNQYYMAARRSATYGYSLHYTRLQPPSPTVTDSILCGDSLHHLQVMPPWYAATASTTCGHGLGPTARSRRGTVGLEQQLQCRHLGRLARKVDIEDACGTPRATPCERRRRRQAQSGEACGPGRWALRRWWPRTLGWIGGGAHVRPFAP